MELLEFIGMCVCLVLWYVTFGMIVTQYSLKPWDSKYGVMYNLLIWGFWPIWLSYTAVIGICKLPSIVYKWWSSLPDTEENVKN